MCGAGRETLAALVRRLPAGKLVFAYGSAVKPQLKARKERGDTAMVDLCVCVPAEECGPWHAANLRLNADHYSPLRLMGAERLALWQRAFGARVYFNTLVAAPDLGLLFKYGVVAEEDLLEDLDRWTHLYFAGRLHKPVQFLVSPEDARLQEALRHNLVSALRAALLLLPSRFSRFDLFHAVSDLSYSGDFRMTFGENKRKVANIVAAQLDEFRLLYETPLSLLGECVRRVDDDSMEQDADPRVKFDHLVRLPSTPRRVISESVRRVDADDTMRYVAGRPDCSRLVRTSLRRIVWRSSVSQSLKGISTAGVFKSLQYSAKKIGKMFA